MFWKIIQFMFFFGIAFFIVGVWMILHILSSGCGETLLEKTPSPDGSKVIYFFEKGCGATTPNTYHYYLESDGRTHFTQSKELKKRYEFFRRVRGGASVKWISNNQIELLYNSQTHRNSAVIKQKTKINNVRITITETSKKTLLR